jgi:hypothetical protein
MPTSLVHCIYASAATRPFEAPELAELLQKAREANERLGVTGMLLYAEGSFFQILEGPADVLYPLYQKIDRDQRHAQVTKIIWEPIPQRSFDDWTMGFYKVSRKELEGIAGVNDFFGSARCFADIDAGRAKKLLAAFREGNWRQKLEGARQLAGA